MQSSLPSCFPKTANSDHSGGKGGLAAQPSISILCARAHTHAHTLTHSRPWDPARRRAGALPGFCRFPRRGTTASRAPGRTNAQRFAQVPAGQTAAPRSPRPHTGHPVFGLQRATSQLWPAHPSPTPRRASPPPSPGRGPTSRRVEAPRAPRRSSGAPGRAGAAGGGGQGRHGPQPPTRVSAGPLPAPWARVPAGRPPLWASGGRARPAAPSSGRGGAALGPAARPAAPRPPPLGELIRSWRAPGPLPRQRLSQGRADSSDSRKQDLLPDSSPRPFWGVGRGRLNPFSAGDHRASGPGVYWSAALSRGRRP